MVPNQSLVLKVDALRYFHQAPGVLVVAVVPKGDIVSTTMRQSAQEVRDVTPSTLWQCMSIFTNIFLRYSLPPPPLLCLMGSVLRYHALLQHNDLLGILCSFQHFPGERLEGLQVYWWFQPPKQIIHTSKARASRMTEVSNGQNACKSLTLAPKCSKQQGKLPQAENS